MNSKQAKTLKDIFHDPVKSSIEWKDIESLFEALGGVITSGNGSRVHVIFNEVRASFHRPHPEKETDKGAVKSVRRFLLNAGVKMNYKGYTGVVEYDDGSKIFHGEIINTKDVITFQGTSVEEIEREFHNSIDDYLAWCESDGVKPEKPYSGKFNVRISPELHSELAIVAAQNKLSLNAFIEQAIQDEIDKLNPLISAKSTKKNYKKKSYSTKLIPVHA